MEISYRIKEKVTDYIIGNRLIKQGDTIIIGVSGGADSTCLLFLLSEISEKLDFAVRVIHVEHGIRGEASVIDARFVEQLCRKAGLPCKIINVDAIGYSKEHSLTLEEAARILRYKAFDDYKEELRADSEGDVRIAVAHHMNDQAETVLFQMLRGSGLKGMGGMNSRREDVIRPLLCLTREEIINYLTVNGINYRTDESNSDNNYSRNYLRNEIVPMLTELQPQATEHICEMAEELREVEIFIENLAAPIYEKAVIRDAEGVGLKVSELKDTDEVLLKTVLRMAIAECVPNRKDIGRSHFDAIYGLIQKGSGKSINLPKEVVVSRQGDFIRFTKGNKDGESDGGAKACRLSIQINPEETMNDKTVIDLGDDREAVIRSYPKPRGFAAGRNTYTKCFDYDRITNGLRIRNAEAGDYLIVDADGHHKELKDYFVNEKIPASMRDRVLVVADGSHVLWVIGYRISELGKITEKTNNILEISVTGGFPWEKK